MKLKLTLNQQENTQGVTHDTFYTEAGRIVL